MKNKNKQRELSVASVLYWPKLGQFLTQCVFICVACWDFWSTSFSFPFIFHCLRITTPKHALNAFTGTCLMRFFTFSRTCSYTAMGLLLKVMALQKLACLFTVLWDMSMTICEPLVLGWKSRGKADKLPHGWMGRQRFGLWWHRWDVTGNGLFRESKWKRKGVSYLEPQVGNRKHITDNLERKTQILD